jgi:hypothetical protein
MGFAQIQITQGAIVGNPGESVIGLDQTTAITLTDIGGPGATSYLWELLSFPAPDAGPPAITNSTQDVATITPVPSLTDGVYILRLTRNDPVDGVSSDARLFAVEDADTLSLPSSGMNRSISNIGGSTAAQAAGWFGSVVGGTNVFLDAFLRLRRLREGRYQGRDTAFTHSSGSPVATNYTYGVSDPHQTVTMTGAGIYRADLVAAGAEEGAVFRFRVIFNSGAGNFLIRDNGSTVRITLTAPPAGTVTHDVEAYFNGANWILSDYQLLDPLSPVKSKEFLSVAGVQSNSTDTFARIGTLRVDPSIFPASQQITWQATFDTTDPGNAAEVRLYNVTDVAVVAGSTFSTISTTADTQSAVVTLPASSKEYEVQLRLTTTDLAERATCTEARLVIAWG